MHVLLILILWLVAAGGWIANLYKFAMLALESAPITTLFICRGVGVGVLFAPLGSILGYF